MKYGLGLNRWSFFSRSSALVHRMTKKRRWTSSATIVPISLWSSGSPPGIVTTGAPHSSADLTQSSTDRRRLRIGSG